MKLKDYLKQAQKEKWAIGQFNFSTIEQLRGILAAAQKMKSPVILGTSEGESRYLGLKEIVALVEISKIKYRVSAFLNLDHGKDLNWIKKAIDFGYPAVHFDGSELPLEKNIRYAKKVVEYAHKKGVLVEGELGYLRGESKFHKKIARIEKEDLTLPEKAYRFVKETKVDSLAIAIGNIHGIYAGMPKLDFERLKEINKKIHPVKFARPGEIASGTISLGKQSFNEAGAYLVLHGGSGIPKTEIKKAIKFGIVKVNINTELRLTWKKTLEKSFRIQEIRPYKILPIVQKAIQKKVEEKLNLFGSRNKIWKRRIF